MGTREQQMKEEREEEEKEKREEKAKNERARKEELKQRRALEKAKREEDFRQLVASQQNVESSTTAGEAETPNSSQDSVLIMKDEEEVKISPKGATQAAADTSSDVEKKHKEKFVKEMSKVVVKILDPYRKKGVRGHISNTDDSKHLAKKLTYSIMHKELKQCKSIEELKATEKVKKKASEYVSKYMKKYDGEYKKSP